MTYLRSLALSLSLSLLLFVNHSWAGVLYDLTFESPDHTLGQAPTVGAGPSKVSAITFGSPRVVNNQPLLNGNCLEFEGYTSYEQVYLNTGAASGIIQVDFDIVTANVIGSLYGFTVFLDTPEVRSLTFHGPVQQIQAFIPFGGGMLQGFVDGRKYHVTIVADTVGNSWRVSVDGVQRYQSALSASTVSSVRLSMAPMYGMASDNPQSKAYVDNFKVVNNPSTGSGPLVSDVQAVQIRTRDAFLTARINPRGLATNVSFRYWEGSSAGYITPTRTIAATEEFVTVNQFVELKPHTNYNFAVYATNAAGTISQTSSFTSGNTPPSAANLNLHSLSGTEPFALVSPGAIGADIDGDALSVEAIPPGEEGHDPRVSVLGGSLIFTPGPGYDGNAEVKFRVTDGFGGIAPGVVSVTNAAPIARAITLQATPDGQPAQLTLSLLDADGDAVTITALGEPSFGQVSFEENRVTYTPGTGFLGSDAFTYTISDGRGGIATGTIRVSLDLVQHKVLHGTGSAVPGVPGAVWRSFGIPSIFAPGHAGWVAKIRKGSATYDAIFSGPLGEPVLRLRTGAFATNASGAPIRGVTFASFEQPVFAGQNFAFKGKITGSGVTPENADGLWVSDSGVLRLIARDSAYAPGTGGGRYRSLDSVVMPGPKVVFFTATLFDGTRGLWAWRQDSGVQRVLAEGQTITRADNGLRIGRVISFQAISYVPGSPGHGRYDATREAVDAYARIQGGATVLLTVNAVGEITEIERTSAQPLPTRRVLKLGRSSSPGNGMKPVAVEEFDTIFQPGVRYRGVVDFENGSLMAKAGASAPGPGSENILAFKDPVAGLSPSGETLAAFGATLQGAPAGANEGIWSSTNGVLALVAREGDPAPSADGYRFSQFKSLSVFDTRGPIFVASLSPRNETGCWATDSQGKLQLLARTGAVIDGKTVRSIDALTTVPGSQGQRRAWADTTHGALVLFRVSFSDGTQGLVTSPVP